MTRVFQVSSGYMTTAESACYQGRYGQLTQLTRDTPQTTRNKAGRPRYIRNMAVIYISRKPALAILIAPELDGRLWKDLDDVQPVANKEGFDSSLAIQIPDGVCENPDTLIA